MSQCVSCIYYHSLSLTNDDFHLQAKYLVREEKEGCGDCPLHGRVALRRASISSSGNGKTSTSSSSGNTKSSSSASSLPRSSLANRQYSSSNGHGSISSTYDTGQSRPSTPFLGPTRPSNFSTDGRASPSPPQLNGSHPPSLYARFSSPSIHVPAPNTPSVRRKSSSKERPAPPPPTSNGNYREPHLTATSSLRRKHSAPQPPTFPLEAPELIRRNSIGGNPTRHRPPLPSEWSQDVAGSAGRRQQELVRGGGDRRSLRSSHQVAPPSHLNPTFSSLSRTHTVIPLLPSSLPSYFLPSSSPPPLQEEIREEGVVKAENLDLGASLPSRASPSPSLQSILKPPGKRRPSQNHRVGFLDSLGKEIEQGRQFWPELWIIIDKYWQYSLFVFGDCFLGFVPQLWPLVFRERKWILAPPKVGALPMPIKLFGEQIDVN